MNWLSSSGRIALQMTKEQAASVSHSGQCEPDVKALRQVPAIRRQLNKVEPEILRMELKEYGAWDTNELADHEVNLDRLVWIAGCDIDEEVYLRWKVARP